MRESNPGPAVEAVYVSVVQHRILIAHRVIGSSEREYHVAPQSHRDPIPASLGRADARQLDCVASVEIRRPANRRCHKVGGAYHCDRAIVRNQRVRVLPPHWAVHRSHFVPPRVQEHVGLRQAQRLECQQRKHHRITSGSTRQHAASGPVYNSVAAECGMLCVSGHIWHTRHLRSPKRSLFTVEPAGMWPASKASRSSFSRTGHVSRPGVLNVWPVSASWRSASA